MSLIYSLRRYLNEETSLGDPSFSLETWPDRSIIGGLDQERIETVQEPDLENIMDLPIDVFVGAKFVSKQVKGRKYPPTGNYAHKNIAREASSMNGRSPKIFQTAGAPEQHYGVEDVEVVLYGKEGGFSSLMGDKSLEWDYEMATVGYNQNDEVVGMAVSGVDSEKLQEELGFSDPEELVEYLEK